MEAKKGALVNSYIKVEWGTAKFESKNGVEHIIVSISIFIYKSRLVEINFTILLYRIIHLYSTLPLFLPFFLLVFQFTITLLPTFPFHFYLFSLHHFLPYNVTFSFYLCIFLLFCLFSSTFSLIYIFLFLVDFLKSIKIFFSCISTLS